MSEQSTAEKDATRTRRRTEVEARRCSQSGCPGDGRYQPPGRGHLPGCEHNAVRWVWEELPAELPESMTYAEWGVRVPDGTVEDICSGPLADYGTHHRVRRIRDLGGEYEEAHAVTREVTIYEPRETEWTRVLPPADGRA